MNIDGIAAAESKNSGRRIGLENSKQREVFLDAAENILCETGYAGLSAQKVANKAGLTKQLLYYYFKTMDDLILALVRRINSRRLKLLEDALASDEPWNALWDLNVTASAATLATELTAIAGHREAVREEIIAFASQFRARQTELVELAQPKGKKAKYPAAGIVIITSALSKYIKSEEALGLFDGHDEAIQILQHLLSELSEQAT